MHEASAFKQFLRYNNTLDLILQNKGRDAVLTLFNSNSEEIVWTKTLKHSEHYSQNALEMAVDNEGNIAILTIGQYLGKGSFRQPNEVNVVYVVSPSGTVLRQIELRHLSLQSDLYSDGSHFFVLGGSIYDYTHLYKLDKTGLLAEKQLASHNQAPSELYNNRIAELPNGKLVITSDYTDLIIVDKANLDYLVQGKPTNEFTRPNFTLLRNDTIFVATKNETDLKKSLYAYSVSEKKMIWSLSNYNRYYQKMIFGTDGHIYAIGIGQYQGFLIEKIDRRNGNVLWSRIWTYGEDIDARDVFYDATLDQVVVTGSKAVSGENTFLTVIFNGQNGAVAKYDLKNDFGGSGTIIGKLASGELVIGAVSNIDNDCGVSSSSVVYTLVASTPAGVTVSQGIDDRIDVSWDVRSNRYYRVYRGISNIAEESEPVSQWLNASSIQDRTAARGVEYYYFIAAALDDTGTGLSGFTAGTKGYRALAQPVLQLADRVEANRVNVSWNHSEGAVGYKLYRGTTSVKEEAIAITDWTTATEYVDTNIEKDTEVYYYFVQAAADNTGKFSTALSEGMETTELVLGIDNPKISIQIAPNPISDQLRIQFTSSFHGPLSIRLHDVSGKLATEFNDFKRESEFSGVYYPGELPQGMYILTVIENGKPLSRCKIMKR